ncbi:neutral zinc metallopeptidase [Kribbella sp. NPDC026611]|uniref:neutral zinc metallopeptidase n=1 Tax=Kribbella sp. NPDC026611 TaxID=3154911 RepID=UPI0033FEDA7A
MPDDTGGTPKPGHFMPGGEGETVPDGSRPLTLNRARSIGMGKARDVSLADSSLRRKARPLPADPNAQTEYSGPPVAPLTGAPLQPLAGTRRVGGSRPVGWHSNPSRAGAQWSSEPPPIKPPRQLSKAVIGGLSVLIVLMLTGATIAGFKLINRYDNTVDRPLTQPEVKKSTVPLPVPPDVTVTKVAPNVPDIVRLQQNELYKAGKVASVSCKEPAIKPDSQSAILRYYTALLPCLNKAWEPVVTKAGYRFRAPQLKLQSKQPSSQDDCSGEMNVAYYCSTDESINISWKNDLQFYKDSPIGARVWMLDTMAHEYGHHVQQMTEMLTAADSREGWARSNASKLEWSRRTELQATCFGGAFLGANKKSLGLSGNKLKVWEYEASHSGDEYNPKKVRDHGSKKSNWAWAGPAFKSTSPASCNTFTAPASKVS